MTKQAHKDECDVNKILAKYRKTGVLAHLKSNPQTFDYAPDCDFQGALELVEKANAQFMQLPGTIREHFNDSSSDFVAFVSDPENRPEMVEMGLLPKPEPEGIPETPKFNEPQENPTPTED